MNLSETLGYTPEELQRLKIADIEVEFPLATPEQWKEHVDYLRPFHRPEKFNGVWKRKDGSVFPVSVAVLIHTWGGREYMVATAEDLSFVDESRRALQRSEEKFQDFYRNNPLTLLTLNKDGTIFDANPAAHAQLGYSPGRAAEPPDVRFCSYGRPCDGAQLF